MASIKKMIGGGECECFEFSEPMRGGNGKMRMLLNGTFGENNDRESIILVPLSMTEAELSTIGDLWLTEQEKKLGLPFGESCSSSGWWVGSSDESRDMEITNEYDFLIPIALAYQEAQGRLQHEINALYQEQEKIERELKLEYEDGETDWAAQLESKYEDLEYLIADKEALLEKSRLFSIGNIVDCDGYFCEVVHIENNVVCLQDNSSDLHFEVHASEYLGRAQLVRDEQQEKQVSLEKQIRNAANRANEDILESGVRGKVIEPER